MSTEATAFDTLPRPSLDAPELAAKIEKLDASAAPDQAPPEVAAPAEVELPASLSADTLEKTLAVLDARFGWQLKREELVSLATTWQKPLNGAYQRLIAWLGSDPAESGPWAEATLVTLAIFGPRLVPKIIARFTKPPIDAKAEKTTEAKAAEPAASAAPGEPTHEPVGILPGS